MRSSADCSVTSTIMSSLSLLLAPSSREISLLEDRLYAQCYTASYSASHSHGVLLDAQAEVVSVEVAVHGGGDAVGAGADGEPVGHGLDPPRYLVQPGVPEVPRRRLQRRSAKWRPLARL